MADTSESWDAMATKAYRRDFELGHETDQPGYAVGNLAINASQTVAATYTYMRRTTHSSMTLAEAAVCNLTRQGKFSLYSIDN